MRKNLVLHEAVELPLDGFLFFWGLALFPQWNVLLRRVDELFKTWASRITAEAAPGEASGVCPKCGAVSGGARMLGRSSGIGGRKTGPYIKKLPPTMWGTWPEGVLYGEQKGSEPKKTEIFRKNFCSR